MNVLLINDSSSNANWGDRAAAIALKRMIAERGGTFCGIITEDDLRYGRLFRDPIAPVEPRAGFRLLKEWIRLFLPPVLLKLRERAIRYSRLEKPGPVDPIPQTVDELELMAGVFLKERNKFGVLLESIERADIIIIHGDGCMVGCGIIPRTILFLSYVIKHIFNKRIVIINHTADFDHPSLRALADEVYPMFDDVVFRDTVSVEHCRPIREGRYCPDTAFLFEPLRRSEWEKVTGRPGYFDVWPDVACFDPARPYLCMGGSSLFYCEGEPLKIVNGYAELIRQVKTVYAGQVVLTVSDIVDQAVMRPLARMFNLPLIALQTPVQQAVDIVGNADAYIGGRWHPSIFALRGGTPVIPLSSKTFKMRALVKMAGIDFDVPDALNLAEAEDRILHQLSLYIDQGDALRHKLRQWSGQEAIASWGNVSCLEKED